MGGWGMESPVRFLMVSGPKFGGNGILEGVVNTPGSCVFPPSISQIHPEHPSSVMVSWRQGLDPQCHRTPGHWPEMPAGGVFLPHPFLTW